MFSFSMKQLLRQPGKVCLFLLLMVASTVLVIIGTVLTIENTKRIQIVEESYTTIGIVEQLPVNVEVVTGSDDCYGITSQPKNIYDDSVSMDLFDFPTAEYVNPPEYRPVFISYLPDHGHALGTALRNHILEFSPLVNSEPGKPVEVVVTQVLESNIDSKSATHWKDGSEDKSMEIGDTFLLCQHGLASSMYFPLSAGEKYVACLSMDPICPTHGVQEYIPYGGPYSNQRDAEGRWIDKGNYACDIPEFESGTAPLRARIDHVTGDDFYEPGHMGDIYLKWAQIMRMEDHIFPALGVTSLDVLPSWHDKSVNIVEGREITLAEFSQGAPVCMLPQDTAIVNQLSVGSKITLPMLCVQYGDDNFSLLNADGDIYKTFWEQEYEVVGIYNSTGGFLSDFSTDMFIIPTNSVKSGWENNIAGWGPLNADRVSFQLKNGDIAHFDAALKAEVSEMENLQIIYDDQGYSEISRSLYTNRVISLLLLLAGVLASLTIIALLLYFFVVKEMKRTAIERSLGMTKCQCRISLLAGLMILTVIATGAGNLCGVLILDKVQDPSAVLVEDTDSEYTYSTEYSKWAQNRELAQKTEINVDRPVQVFWIVPLCMSLIIFLISLFLMEHNLRVDPIYLLSTKT